MFSPRSLGNNLAALALVLVGACSGPAPQEAADEVAPGPQLAAPVPVIEEVDPPLPALIEAPRGLGTMTAREPGTSEVVGGVRLASHHARVTIAHGVARTEVEEVFHNDTGRVLEGRLVLPLPADATLARLALWVGSQLVEGEVVERDRADRIFRGIVDDTVRPRDPALLDQLAGGKASLRIFPLPARGSRKVIFSYDQVLRREAGGLRYVHPLSLGSDRATPIGSLRVVVNDRVVLDQSDVIPSDDVVVPIDEAPPAVVVSDAGQPAALVRAVARAGDDAARVAGDVAVVLDVSEGQSAASLAAQMHLADAVLERLSGEESFVLLACDAACESYPAQGRAASSRRARSEARAFLAARGAAGPSDLAGALVEAARRMEGARGGQVLVMSDGTSTAGELSAASQLAHAAPRLASLDVRVVGVGRAVDDRSLTELARGLGATYDRLATGAPLAGRVAQLAESRRAPVVRDPRPALPAGLADPQPAEPVPARAGDEVITLARVTGPVEGATAARTPIARLWAREQVARLEARGELAEVTTLSLRHHLLSRTTSLLVLENDRMFAEFGIPRVTRTEEPAVGELAPRKAQGHPPRVRMGMTLVSGRLPPESVQRVIRQNSGRFRACYEDGLRRRPGLQGRVSVRFVIARDGSVSGAIDEGSDLPDPEVIACVIRAYLGLSFTQPEGGVVHVVYPLVFGLPGAAKKEPERLATMRPNGVSLGGTWRPWPENSMYNPPPWEPPPVEPPTATHRAGDDRWLGGTNGRVKALTARASREPERRGVHLDLIRALLAAGRLEDAHEAARKLASLDPDLPAAREALADAAAAAGQGEEAVAAVAAAAALDPRSAARQLAAARAAAAAGDDRRACAHLRALGEIEPRAHGERASRCREGGAPSLPAATSGGFEASVACDGRCPTLAVITPAGRVLSPWTSGSAGPSAASGSLMAGSYRTLVVAGERRGKLSVRALGASFSVDLSPDDARRTLVVSDVTVPPERVVPRVRF